MKAILFLILVTFTIEAESYESHWRSYPACKIGRLQSPIALNLSDSTYNNTFSFVYQGYLPQASKILESGESYTAKSADFSAGYINFAKGGVIKQYEFIRAEIYEGLHPVENDDRSVSAAELELHLVHKKLLGFKTNKNQYRTIQEANNYLVIVLRYNTSDCVNCTYDNGLLSQLTSSNNIDLSNYPIFQDKRAYYYEGSFIYTPCDEDVNYYVVKDLFQADSSDLQALIEKGLASVEKPAYSFGRPIYRNFMNYTESLDGYSIRPNVLVILVALLICFGI